MANDSPERKELDRVLNALALELPASVHADASRRIRDLFDAALDAARQQQRAELLPIVEGEGLKIMVDGKPLWLASLPANLIEVKRGLEQGLFGPPWEGGQKWANAAMCLCTIEDARRAVELLIAALDAVVPGVREDEP